MGSVSIRLAGHADEPAIVRFLEAHWRTNHIFVSHPEVMRWQHRTDAEERNGLAFVIATRDASAGGEEVLGLLGYIPFRRFDPEADWTALSLAIWKVREGLGLPGLGLRLLKYLRGQLRPDLICAIGITDVVRPIYQALGYEVGTMAHAALFPESSRSKLEIASGVPAEAFRPLPSPSNITIEPVESICGLGKREVEHCATESIPHKSLAYIQARYVEYPFQSYGIHEVRQSGTLRAILVWRRVEALGSAILRIVDVIGDASILAVCGSLLRESTISAGCEYCDLVYHGTPPNVLESGGFVDRDLHDGLILPNYFDPFVQKNVTLQMAYRRYGRNDSVRLYRADSDQDRPNSAAAISRSVRT